MNFSDELIEKAKSAKTVEELIALAKAENIELTGEQANDYFAKLNPKSGEISDEELENVSGGACYELDGRLVVTQLHICELYKCHMCGTKYKTEHISPCKLLPNCTTCSYCTDLICNEPRNHRDYKK